MGLLYVLHSRAATSLPCAPNLTTHPQLGYYSQEVNEPPEPAIAQKMREHCFRLAPVFQNEANLEKIIMTTGGDGAAWPLSG